MNDTELSLVDAVAAQAAQAAPQFARTEYAVRRRLLESIADAIDGAADQLVPLARAETNLPEARLRGEVARTTYQLRSFARLLLDGRQLGIAIEHSDPAFPLGGPSPDLRMMSLPVGPVAVFAASNFPFAFSVAGGDTASALAAGCPVVVKAHPGHPSLSRATADLIRGVLDDLALPTGIFGMIEGQEAGVRLVQHPAIRAAAFTGSTAGGRALFDIATRRPEPIPFYGELGSINPVYVTREAMGADADAIAAGFVDSYTTGAGQLCTKPGVVFVPARHRTFARTVLERIDSVQPARLLNDAIAGAFERSGAYFDRTEGVTVLRRGGDTGDGFTPALFTTSLDAFLQSSESLTHERFGPSALLVEYEDAERLASAAQVIGGTLTSTIHADAVDDAGLTGLLPVAAQMSGRLIWNSWPTGVTVSPAMMHGGPYPASTAPLHTSVGATAIARFLRPVAFQGFPDEALPAELRESNPLGLARSVDSLRAEPGDGPRKAAE